MFVFEGLSVEEARRFGEAWLSAWTGNGPERLLEFYADDAFYSWARGDVAPSCYELKDLSKNDIMK